jgi:hypothetical protein
MSEHLGERRIDGANLVLNAKTKLCGGAARLLWVATSECIGSSRGSPALLTPSQGLGVRQEQHSRELKCGTKRGGSPLSRLLSARFAPLFAPPDGERCRVERVVYDCTDCELEASIRVYET